MLVYPDEISLGAGLRACFVEELDLGSLEVLMGRREVGLLLVLAER